MNRNPANTLTRPDGQQARTEATQPIRVLIADDHTVVRQSLRYLLDLQNGIEVVGEAANGREAIDLAEKLKPDVC